MQSRGKQQNGKTRDFVKKIGEFKGTFHARMGMIKDRNGKDLTEAHEVKKHICVLSHFSYVRLFVTLWTIAHQASQSMEFSRQDYWSGLPCPPSGDFLDLGIKLVPLGSSVLADGFFNTRVSWEALSIYTQEYIYIYTYTCIYIYMNISIYRYTNIYEYISETLKLHVVFLCIKYQG